MKLIWTMAWRNIARHKGKTYVIGFILFLGAYIMAVGNGVISGINQGLERNIINSFSGDMVIMSEKQTSEDILLSQTGQTLEPIRHYKTLKSPLLQLPFVADILPAGVGYVWVLNDSGSPVDQFILGVDFEQYRKFFPDNLTVVEGRLFQPDERGVLVSTRIRELLFDYCNYWVIPENGKVMDKNLTEKARKYRKKLDARGQLIFLGLSRKNATLDIACDVKGVFKFRELNALLGFYALVDIESLRECMGYYTAENANASLSAEQQKLINATDAGVDSLFDSSFTATKATATDLTASLKRVDGSAVVPSRDIETGVYNMILVKLKPGYSLTRAIAAFNTASKANKWGLKAVSWHTAIGMLGMIALLAKSALFLFVSFIFFVAIIIIMNTLTMTTMERTSEIGMMRAVGARKWFVARMLLAETSILSLIFGGLGILLGWATCGILSMLKFTTDLEVMQLFYGGDTFQPVLTVGDLAMCILLLVLVTCFAVFYPVLIARRITPLDAIMRD